MRADARAGPVQRLIDIRERGPPSTMLRDEFVHQVGVRTAVAAALDEGEMGMLVVVHASGGEALNFSGAGGRSRAPSRARASRRCARRAVRFRSASIRMSALSP